MDPRVFDAWNDRNITQLTQLGFSDPILINDDNMNRPTYSVALGGCRVELRGSKSAEWAYHVIATDAYVVDVDADGMEAIADDLGLAFCFS